MKQTGFIFFSMHLGTAQKSLQKLKNKNMEPYGLGSAHTVCLCLLFEYPEGITKTEMTRLCGVDKAQISRVISELEEKHYVTTQKNGSHYRQKYKLTEEGCEAAREIQSIIERINHFVSGEIPKEELLAFYATFSKICDNLKRAESQFLTETQNQEERREIL